MTKTQKKREAEKTIKSRQGVQEVKPCSVVSKKITAERREEGNGVFACVQVEVIQYTMLALLAGPAFRVFVSFQTKLATSPSYMYKLVRNATTVTAQALPTNA